MDENESDCWNSDSGGSASSGPSSSSATVSNNNNNNNNNVNNNNSTNNNNNNNGITSSGSMPLHLEAGKGYTFEEQFKQVHFNTPHINSGEERKRARNSLSLSFAKCQRERASKQSQRE